MTTFAKQSITGQAAASLIAAAQAKAQEMNIPMAIAIVDESGNLKAFVRMDGAPLLSSQVAQDKAYTAVGFGIPTKAWAEYFGHDKPLWDNLHAIQRAVAFGGGHPIKISGKVVGGIGVSGGHYNQDDAVAEAALETLS